MTHLNIEQLEDVLHGSPPPAHLADCPVCRARLEEQQAVRERLRASLAGLCPPAGLADRIRRGLAQATPPEVSPPGPTRPAPAAREFRTLSRRIHRLWPLLAAAMIVVAATVALVALTRPQTALASELYRIHHHAVTGQIDLLSADEPVELARYFRQHLGFEPAMPRLGVGMKLRGCCVARFRDRPVGSYVVDTPQGVISIIVVSETPAELGFSSAPDGHWSDAYANSRLAATRLGNYTYCAVGEVPREYLTELVDQLLNGA